MNIGQKIKNLREQKGMTLEELGNKVGVGKSTVRKWETGMITNMKRDKITKLAAALDTSPSYLIGWDDTDNLNKIKDQIINVREGTTQVPVLGKVAAGVPKYIQENYIGYEDVSNDMIKDDTVFGLEINGDSMSPRILKGDVVIVREQNDAESGDVVIVSINGDEATCKRLMKYADGISLISFNPAYEPMTFSNKDIEEKPVRIIGKVIENRSKF